MELRANWPRMLARRITGNYRWQQTLRLDYTRRTAWNFNRLLSRWSYRPRPVCNEKHRQHMGVDRLRPWDLDQDLYPLELPPLPPYGSVQTWRPKPKPLSAASTYNWASTSSRCGPEMRG